MDWHSSVIIVPIDILTFTDREWGTYFLMLSFWQLLKALLVNLPEPLLEVTPQLLVEYVLFCLCHFLLFLRFLGPISFPIYCITAGPIS